MGRIAILVLPIERKKESIKEHKVKIAIKSPNQTKFEEAPKNLSP